MRRDYSASPESPSPAFRTSSPPASGFKSAAHSRCLSLPASTFQAGRYGLNRDLMSLEYQLETIDLLRRDSVQHRKTLAGHASLCLLGSEVEDEETPHTLGDVTEASP